MHKLLRDRYPASIAPEVDAHDKRHKKWKKQRKERGFDDTELWNLDSTFGKLMLPRVKAYVKMSRENVIRDEQWEADMLTIITMLELLSSGEQFNEETSVPKIEEGLKVFAQRLPGMWD